MFNTVDTMHDCTRIATGVVSTLKINPDRMLAGLSADMLATDLAEYLVRKGARVRIPTDTRPYCLLTEGSPWQTAAHVGPSESCQSVLGRPISAGCCYQAFQPENCRP